jgi:hypothetical protein
VALRFACGFLNLKPYTKLLKEATQKVMILKNECIVAAKKKFN